MTMANRTSSTRPTRSADDRRSRLRLRDLCDEVLASFRVARGADPISEADRTLADAVLSGLMPRAR